MGGPTMKSTCIVLLAWLSSLTVMAQSQPADTAAPVAVEVLLPYCAKAAWNMAALVQRLRVELAADGVRGLHVRRDSAALALETDRSIIAALRFQVACDLSPPVARIEVQDTATQQWVGRVVPLRDVQVSAVPQTLALAMVELLHARWAELLQRDVPGLEEVLPQLLRERLKKYPPRTDQPQQPSVPTTPQAESTPVKLRPFIGGRWYTGSGNVLPDVGFLLGYGIVEGGVSLMLGEVSDDLGDRLWVATQLRLGVWFLRFGDPNWLALGVHGETGLGWTGQGPEQAEQTLQSGLGLYSNIMLDARSSWKLGPKLNIFGQISGGYSGNPICFDEHCALVGGGLVALSVGLDITP